MSTWSATVLMVTYRIDHPQQSQAVGCRFMTSTVTSVDPNKAGDVPRRQVLLRGQLFRGPGAPSNRMSPG